MKKTSSFTIYTDGACSGNPGPGGTGYAVIIKNELILSGSTGYRKTTNNRMEISAATEALKAFQENLTKWLDRDTDIKVNVCSDSQLVVNTMTKCWRKKTNEDLWKRLDDQVAMLAGMGVGVDFTWVKGHDKDQWNNFVDGLAVQASRNPVNTDDAYENIGRNAEPSAAGDKPFATVFLVSAVEKEGDEPLSVRPLRTYSREENAVEFGIRWARDRNEHLVAIGSKIQASYKVTAIGLF